MARKQATLPNVILLVGSAADQNAYESARTHSIWRALCQCAETWRIDVGFSSPRGAAFERHFREDESQLAASLPELIKSSGAKTLVLASGARLPEGFNAKGVRVCAVASDFGIEPTAAEVWSTALDLNVPVPNLASDAKSFQLSFEAPVSDWAEADTGLVAVVLCGGSADAALAEMDAIKNGALVPVVAQADEAAVKALLPAGAAYTTVPTRADALQMAANCIFLGDDAAAAGYKCWAELHGRTVLLPVWSEDDEAAQARLDPWFDSLATLTDIARALGTTPPEEANAVGALIQRNLGIDVLVVHAAFHPYVRLFHSIYEVHGNVCKNLVTGNIVSDRADEGGLVNAWVQEINGRPDDPLRMRATAAVAPDSSTEEVRVEIDLWGWPFKTFAATEQLVEDAAGLVSLELTEDRKKARAIYWTNVPDTPIQFGKKLIKTPPLASSSEGGPMVHAGQGDFPFNRDTLTVLPPDARNQKYTRFEVFNNDRHPSSLTFEKMKGSLAGKIGWLIGNGPSVRLEDLDQLADAGAICFGFNRFHLAHDQTKLRPNFTVTGDLQMIEDFGQQIVDDSGGTVFVADGRPPQLTGDYVWLRQMSVFPSLFSFDASRFVTPGGSSVYVALQVGHFLGIRKWYIYGADFGFKFARPRIGGGAFRSASGDGNHFISNYRSGRPWCPPSIENILPSFYGARLVMESDGGFIRNATRGGHLNVFERIEFEDALAATQGSAQT